MKLDYAITNTIVDSILGISDKIVDDGLFDNLLSNACSILNDPSFVQKYTNKEITLTMCNNGCLQISCNNQDIWYKNQKKGWCRMHRSKSYFLFHDDSPFMKREHFYNNNNPLLHDSNTHNQYTITNYYINPFVHECQGNMYTNCVYSMNGNGFSLIMNEGTFNVDWQSGLRMDSSFYLILRTKCGALVFLANGQGYE